MAFSGSQTTRVGLYGGPRQLYGSFSGKTDLTFISRRQILAGDFTLAGASIHTGKGHREVN